MEFFKHGGGLRLSMVENRLLVIVIGKLNLHDILSGRRLNNIELKDLGGSLMHAIESNRDSFLVSTYCYREHKGKVTEIDSKGQVIRVFESTHISCGYMALDSFGRVIVADRKIKQIILLNEDLEYERVLINKEQLDKEHPRRLNYNKNNNSNTNITNNTNNNRTNYSIFFIVILSQERQPTDGFIHFWSLLVLHSSF